MTLIPGLATVLGGAAAGLTGLGGGQILSPLFLELGTPPQQAAATSLLLVLCNSAGAALQVCLSMCSACWACPPGSPCGLAHWLAGAW